ADAVRAVAGTEEVFDHAAVAAVDALHADGEVRHDLALAADDVLAEVLVADVGIARLGEAAEDGRLRVAAEIGLRGRIGHGAGGAVIEDARLALVRERADDEVHRDLFVVAAVRAEDLRLVQAARVPGEAEARRVVFLQIDLRHAGGVDDLLAVPAHAGVD